MLPTPLPHTHACRRFHGANAAVPSTPLFLGEEQLAALRLEPGKAYSSFSSSLEWAVAEPGSVLDSAVKRLLRSGAGGTSGGGQAGHAVDVDAFEGLGC